MWILFPAWAGVILGYYKSYNFSSSIPRMGGGDPYIGKIVDKVGLYSPHGRG